MTDRDPEAPASPRRSDPARDEQSNARALDARTDDSLSSASSGLFQYRANVWRPEGRSGAAPAWAGSALWVGLTAAAAALAALATSQAPAFYAALDKPVWAPPASIFGPVWSVLYALMAWAAVSMWQRGARQPRARLGLWLYAAALVPNAMWSWTFFHWHLGAMSLAVIGVLWGLLLSTLLAFRRVRAASALLLLPVFLWVTFAAALNARLWQLNPALL
jgi:tryptophan-rich sensory protein